MNELLQNNLFDVQAELPYNKMAMILGDILESNAYIISSSGLGYTEKLDVNNARIKICLKRKISSRIHRGRGYAQSNRSQYSNR